MILALAYICLTIFFASAVFIAAVAIIFSINRRNL